MKPPDTTKARVLVVGDVMLDRYWYGDASRISPGVRVDSVDQVLNRGDVVTVEVTEVDTERGRVGLKLVSKTENGAEVSAELPAPSRVWRALDTEGTVREPDDIENVGTRHRAAYRFVHDHPAGLAIVISYDGGVSFVANRDGEVVFWEQSVGP